MITVVLQVAGPSELEDRLAQLAADGTEVTLATPFGLFSAGIKGDAILFCEAERRVARYLASWKGETDPYQQHVIYWLKVAADIAHREAREHL